MSNKRHTVLYTGVTSALISRDYQHKNKMANGFTKKYNIDQLLYFEIAENAEAAITREKQIKKYSRKKKLDLINKQNPNLDDLYDTIANPDGISRSTRDDN